MSDSSSDEESRPGVSAERAPPPRPPEPPKIPPPPEDLPPPYNSHHVQTTSLIRNDNHQTSQRSSNNRVRPPGIHRFTSLINKKTVTVTVIALVIILIGGLCLFIWNESKEGYKYEPETVEGTTPLMVKWKLLGEFKDNRQKLSFDENSDSLVLSKFNPYEHEIQAEILSIENYMDGYTLISSNVSDKYENCQRFTPDIICCSTTKHGHSHRTDCYLGEKENTIHTSASHFDYSSNWQSLTDDNRMLLVFTHTKHALLDLRTGKISKIEENRMSGDYKSMGFFFPMDNIQELDELVRSGQDFRICEYLKTNFGDYALQDRNCKKTPFHVEYDLRKVKFCSNPVYSAVIQYGHVDEERDLTWRLRLSIDGQKDVYGTAETFETDSEELVIDCNDETIEVYVVGKYELSQYTVELPSLRSERAIQSRLR